MTKTNDIRIVLENHLATTTPSLPTIAWPNIPFTPVPGTSYLTATFIPVTRRPVTPGLFPEQRHAGLFLVNVCTPEDGGAAAGMTIADQIQTRFNGSDAVVTSSVTVRFEYSEVKRPLHTPPFYVIPVEIGWYSYVS